MNNPNPDEPCWCGSGYPYQRCHMRIDAYPANKRVLGARTLYSEMWMRNAESIETQKGYEWMTGLLTPANPKRILDIGCGTGNGIAALSAQFPDAKLISVDENPVVISAAKERLVALGATVNVVNRLSDAQTGPRSHSLTHEQGKLKLTDGIDLIESDILTDSELDRFLSNEMPFDAITVWLIGSHLLRYHECDSHRGEINSPMEYRLHVQGVACGLASLLLKPGGVLHIVDRGRVPQSDEERQLVLANPKMLTSLTQGVMRYAVPSYFPLTATNPTNAIKMVSSSGKVVDSSEMALISYMFHKA